MTGNVWFITGGSDGFGRAIALEALKRGDKVVATSRNLARMADLAAAGALTLALDVTADDATIQAALRKAIDAYGPITHCLNSAGYAIQGTIEELSAKEVADQFATNVLGTLNVTRNVLPIMRPRRRGVIANFGSLWSWGGGPGLGPYVGTKWAVSGLTESLDAEVRALGLAAVVIEAGYFRTGIAAGNRVTAARRLAAEYAGLALPAGAQGALEGRQPGDPAKGARVIVDALTRSGAAAGRDIPPRLVLGRDALRFIRDKLTATQRLLSEWEDVIVSTDYDDIA
ncbi:estradiol 17-beta-dehydrogenase [Durotheca rogersii]|uniref:estradiol 17-beta-dehydrogenase n=1 Tax=Durotheca rogersii TaxID=419775 RepID=UPI00221F3D67|nr:estradiol 17-beta-dehydrogenase [Durotheca rogersii]KAI5865437.1 estradiol 17-beta-dehydrogenase [Durotheca rogersii]